jgi:thiamine biosynthesis lipoprotein
MKFLLLFLIFTPALLNAKLITRTQVIMGTFISVKAEDKYTANSIFKIFKAIENSLSSYKKTALVYKLNKNRKINLDRYLYEALTLSKVFYKNTDGYFDITIGSITKDLYHFGEDERVANQNELKKAKVNIKGIHFNKKNATLDDGIKVDLGGMGKGYAVDKAVESLKAKGVTKAIITASGDIRCLDMCKISVQNPFDNEAMLSFKTLKKDMGISTSGNYNRYVESTKNNHLINPKLKRPQDKFISITLISKMPNSYLDAYATASSVMPLKKAYKFLNSLELVYVILQSDKKLVFSKDFSKYAKDLIFDNAID